MNRIYEDRFFSFYKDSDKAYSVATLCAQALMVKYDIDKCYSNSGENCPPEAKVYVYNAAVESINEVSKTVDIAQIDLDLLFKEIQENLKELKGEERTDYCISLLAPFGDGCSFIDTYLPIGKINRINARIERYEKEKKELEMSVASNDTEEIRKRTNLNSLAHFIESDEKMIANARRVVCDFTTLPQKGYVEKFYSKLFRLLQRYAYRLAWIFVKNGMDIFTLQDECNIYIINPQQGHDASIYAQWASSYELAQKGVDVLIKKERKYDCDLPEELNTEMAVELLNKAVANGLLNEDYSPTEKLKTKSQKALLADILSERLELRHKYKPFEKLWNVSRLAQQRYRSKEEIGKVRGEEYIYAAFE